MRWHSGKPPIRSRPERAVICVLFALGLGACATTPAQVAQKEDDLVAAGFWSRPADTAEHQKMIAALPSHQFIKRETAGAVSYVYADTLVCACLYVGSQEAYDLYTSSMRAKNKADEHAMLARMYANPDWRWREWGETADPAHGPALGW
jgi:hypothetical protein